MKIEKLDKDWSNEINKNRELIINALAMYCKRMSELKKIERYERAERLRNELIESKKWQINGMQKKNT